MLYSPGLFPSSYGKTSSALEGLEAESPRPLAWIFRRLRFSRSACFNRCCRESCFGFPAAPPVWPSPRSLSSVIANLFEFVLQPMAKMHAAINGLAPLRQWAGLSFATVGHLSSASTMLRRIFAAISANRGESGRFRADLAVFSVPKRRPALAKPGPLWQGSARLEGPFGPILVIRACCRSSVVEHSIGNGEVDSSILSGSTSFLVKSAFFLIPQNKLIRSNAERRRMHQVRKTLGKILLMPSSGKQSDPCGPATTPRRSVRCTGDGIGT
jgi:hypothetical protein